MSNELQLIKKRSPSSEAFLRLMSQGKQTFKLVFPEAKHSFDSIAGNVQHLRDRSTTGSNANLYFTQTGTTDVPLPTRYAQVVKSWLISEYKLGPRSAVHPLGTARILWDAILARRNGEPKNFHWDNLCDEDLNQAEILMRERWGQNTTYKCTSHLLSLARFAARKALSRQLYYVPQTPRVEDSNRHTIAGREERKAKLPSKNSLHGLAEIYRLAIDPPDQLLSSAIAITAAAGFRVGELLTLPYDCEVNEERAGKPRYGRRYYKEKSRGDERLFAMRWLTPIQAELARDAIGRIRSITKTSRHRAQVLEDNPQRVPIPDNAGTGRFTPQELAKLFGFKGEVRFDGLKRQRDKQGFFFQASDVEASLLSKRVRRLWTVDRRNGSHQMLSETLLIAPNNFFHSRRGTCHLLVEPLNVQNISDFLSGRTEMKSAFERFDIKESNGVICRMTSHQLRYWLNDIADKGGLPVDTLTRWMGRDNPRDTEAYRFETADEKCKRIEDGIRAGEIHGHISDLYFSLPVDEREIFLESQVESVHFTPMRICAHDYSLSPCDRHLNCVRGTCPDYLRTKGNQNERTHLIQII